MQDPRVFHVQAQRFFDTFVPDAERARHELAMEQLISRFDLGGCAILSVGAGDASQEYWLHRAGATLFCVDLDEHGSLAPQLERLSSESSGGDSFAYVIADATRPSPVFERQFDAVFFSGFTPDEEWRIDIQKARSGSLPAAALGWPGDGKPLSPPVVKIVQHALRPGGLLVKLSYLGGPDVARSSTFLPSLVKQCRDEGLELVELYHLRNAPGVHLMIVYRGERSEALRYAEGLADRPPITLIHGRSGLGSRARRTYALGKGASFAVRDRLAQLVGRIEEAVKRAFRR